MIRGVLVITTLLLALEPSLSPDMDLARYAITQGGLALVIFVLLWSYRRDFLRVIERHEEQASVLVTLVKENTAAGARTAATIEASEKAIDRLVRVLEGQR